MILLLFLWSSFVFGMDRQPSEIPNSPFYISDKSRDTDEDSMCDNVLNVFHTNRSVRFDQRVKPFLKDIIKDHVSRSGEEMPAISHEIMTSLVQQAVHQSFDDLENKNDAKWSKKKASIMVATATVLTSIIAIIVDSTTCKR